MTLYNNPEELIKDLQEKENVIRVKVKCLSCTSASFMPYEKPRHIGSKLIIGDSTFPAALIESVKVQYYFHEDFKTTEYWKVDRNYFRKYLTQEALSELDKYQA